MQSLSIDSGIIHYVSTFVVRFTSLTYHHHRKVTVQSPEIARASLHIALPWYSHLYTLPFLSLYPVLAYAYYVKYDHWLGGEEWTFLACVSLGAGHALSFLVTKWSAGARAIITTRRVSNEIDLF